MPSTFSEWAGDKRLKILVLLVLALAAVALVAYSFYTYKQSKYLFSGPTTISVTGKGEIFAKPDIGNFTFSVMAEGADAVVAQGKSAESINKIYAYLKEKGVEEKDIKTTYYNLNPKYEYSNMPCTQFSCPPQTSRVVGFTVDQGIEVKVRKTDMAGELISGVGTQGATNISGLAFTTDDPAELKAEARAKAIEDAKKQAEKLAGDLDVKIVRMMNYWEQENQPYPMYDRGYGGGMMESAASAPSVPTGESTITSTVTMTYEVR